MINCRDGHRDDRVVFCTACGFSRIEALVEASSLGCRDGRAVWDGVPDAVAQRLTTAAQGEVSS